MKIGGVYRFTECMKHFGNCICWLVNSILEKIFKSGIYCSPATTDYPMFDIEFSQVLQPLVSSKVLHSILNQYESDVIPVANILQAAAFSDRLKTDKSVNKRVIDDDDDYIEALEDRLGDDYFQMRLQFRDLETDEDGQNDLVRFTSSHLPVLIVDYYSYEED